MQRRPSLTGPTRSVLPASRRTSEVGLQPAVAAAVQATGVDDEDSDDGPAQR